MGSIPYLMESDLALVVKHPLMMGHGINPSWKSHSAYCHSSQCSTTGVSDMSVCVCVCVGGGGGGIPERYLSANQKG